ncbi:uncharacterized protein M421DRAFT_108581 [Didymella exigua CBS 183.55]|uniref:Uncharacterized protein n=1 Tax=Didymella exigua CBS 183.55 TaxID=1150837 RepID=A0A6A5RZT9_9PLEO|nr:uncharacterized protein M421DRAFT_108581 [Didymella exigua CBS 183.55]KAF1933931.1 hypothetical protein M421DRAFT_108581 [Didymella exigua CBS 183.55]
MIRGEARHELSSRLGFCIFTPTTAFTITLSEPSHPTPVIASSHRLRVANPQFPFVTNTWSGMYKHTRALLESPSCASKARN